MGDHFVGGGEAEFGAGVGAGECAGLGDGEEVLRVGEGVGGEVVDGLVGGGLVGGVGRGGVGRGGEHGVDGFGEEGFEWFLLGEWGRGVSMVVLGRRMGGGYSECE